MIKDLLDTNLLKAGQGIPLVLGTSNLTHIAKTVLSELETIHGPRFRLVGANKNIIGIWDSDALSRVLENLVNNAVKYGDRDQIVTVTIGQQAERVAMSVHNMGPVIPADLMASLFKAYHRTDSAKYSGQKGWGIGLTLVQGIVEAHSGEVQVESEVDIGTTFTVLLPLESHLH